MLIILLMIVILSLENVKNRCELYTNGNTSVNYKQVDDDIIIRSTKVFICVSVFITSILIRNCYLEKLNIDYILNTRNVL